ncbi:hypothetical protein F4777DRAFT_595760 [Nemania sp. FL0916]|nr:hypothetical protein F4777DRAFT_595760 [Nemania sp. FL0916]
MNDEEPNSEPQQEEKRDFYLELQQELEAAFANEDERAYYLSVISGCSGSRKRPSSQQSPGINDIGRSRDLHTKALLTAGGFWLPKLALLIFDCNLQIEWWVGSLKERLKELRGPNRPSIFAETRLKDIRLVVVPRTASSDGSRDLLPWLNDPTYRTLERDEFSFAEYAAVCEPSANFTKETRLAWCNYTFLKKELRSMIGAGPSSVASSASFRHRVDPPVSHPVHPFVHISKNTHNAVLYALEATLRGPNTISLDPVEYYSQMADLTSGRGTVTSANGAPPVRAAPGHSGVGSPGI